MYQLIALTLRNLRAGLRISSDGVCTTMKTAFFGPRDVDGVGTWWFRGSETARNVWISCSPFVGRHLPGAAMGELPDLRCPDWGVTFLVVRVRRARVVEDNLVG